MKNKLIFLSLLLNNYLLYSQGAFVNLGFESNNLTPVPQGEFGVFVPVDQGIPGWSAFLGTNQTSSILHNNLTLGGANIAILGPQWTPISIIEGGYTVVLQAGGLSSTFVNASISQTGFVPHNSQSIFFKALGSDFSVSLAGQTLSLLPISVAPNYTLYGADVSQFAGQSGVLTFTALSVPSHQFNNVSLDSIMFSTTSVPEPRTIVLTITGVCLVGFRRWRNRG